MSEKRGDLPAVYAKRFWRGLMLSFTLPPKPPADRPADFDGRLPYFQAEPRWFRWKVRELSEEYLWQDALPLRFWRRSAAEAVAQALMRARMDETLRWRL